jgi:hypothetical protein
METLKWSDQRNIAEFARDLYGQNSIKAISERVVQRLDTLIGGNSTVVVLNPRKADAPHVLAENIGARVSKTDARDMGVAARSSWFQISSGLCCSGSRPFGSHTATSAEKDQIV